MGDDCFEGNTNNAIGIFVQAHFKELTNYLPNYY